MAYVEEPPLLALGKGGYKNDDDAGMGSDVEAQAVIIARLSQVSFTHTPPPTHTRMPTHAHV